MIDEALADPVKKAKKINIPTMTKAIMLLCKFAGEATLDGERAMSRAVAVSLVSPWLSVCSQSTKRCTNDRAIVSSKATFRARIWSPATSSAILAPTKPSMKSPTSTLTRPG